MSISENVPTLTTVEVPPSRHLRRRTAAVLTGAVSSTMAALMVLAAPAQAATVLSSSFEYPRVPGGSYEQLDHGDYVDGWRVDSGTVDLIGRNYWRAADGRQSVDLNGTSAGALTRRLRTDPRQRYELQFSLAGNPQGGPAIKRVRVTVGDVSRVFGFDTSGRTVNRLGWVEHTLRFNAHARNTEVTFESLTRGSYGPALDDIQVDSIH
ncbi:DUF642 domain-containing protein [Frankia sp. AiPs1]|uniref:choice-of-anchor C family protein n=1 Tax=Frankia sp. AiPa1 TaxID=573492 RepID=UPI00202B8FF6|nr:choice-of-anchor C family protein [Frankia sp. AiPa1]MCL9761682.1 choice-of-anchor C family protein [Frankia sp. AiPa1]